MIDISNYTGYSVPPTISLSQWCWWSGSQHRTCLCPWFLQCTTINWLPPHLIWRTLKIKISETHCTRKLKLFLYVLIYRDLSYGEILAGRPVAWLVKKIFFICMQSQNLKKDLALKFKIISRTSFAFIIAFMVYE